MKLYLKYFIQRVEPSRAMSLSCSLSRFWRRSPKNNLYIRVYIYRTYWSHKYNCKKAAKKIRYIGSRHFSPHSYNMELSCLQLWLWLWLLMSGFLYISFMYCTHSYTHTHTLAHPMPLYTVFAFLCLLLARTSACVAFSTVKGKMLFIKYASDFQLYNPLVRRRHS